MMMNCEIIYLRCLCMKYGFITAQTFGGLKSQKEINQRNNYLTFDYSFNFAQEQLSLLVDKHYYYKILQFSSQNQSNLFYLFIFRIVRQCNKVIAVGNWELIGQFDPECTSLKMMNIWLLKFEMEDNHYKLGLSHRYSKWF